MILNYSAAYVDRETTKCIHITVDGSDPAVGKYRHHLHHGVIKYFERAKIEVVNSTGARPGKQIEASATLLDGYSNNVECIKTVASSVHVR